MSDDLEPKDNNTESDKPDREKSKKRKRSDTSTFIRGSAMLFVGRIIAIMLKFIIQILIVRYLPKQEYGAFAYALNMVDIAVILSLVALDKSASRFVPIFEEEKDYDSLFGFIVLSLVIILGLGAAIVLLFISSSGYLTGTLISDPLAASLLVIVIILAPLTALDNWFQGIFAAFTNVKAIFFRRYILLPVFQLLVVIFVFLTQSNVFWLAGGYVLGGIIGTAMYVFLLFSVLHQRGILREFNWQTIKLRPYQTLSFSLPMFFTGFVLIIRSQLAIIILEIFHGTIAIAEYRAVQPVVRLNSVVYSSFVLLYLPLAASLYARQDRQGINDIFWRSAAWIAVVNLPVFLVSFSLARPVVTTILGESYASSAIIMAIMSFGAYFNAVMGFNKDTLRAYNKVRYLLISDIIVMFVALGSYFVFIPQYGAVGAAIAYSTALVMNNVMYHIGLVRFTSTKIFETKYITLYLMIATVAISLGIAQLSFNFSIWIGLPIAAIISLIVLRLTANQLQVSDIFPELLKVPILKQFIR